MIYHPVIHQRHTFAPPLCYTPAPYTRRSLHFFAFLAAFFSPVFAFLLSGSSPPVLFLLVPAAPSFTLALLLSPFLGSFFSFFCLPSPLEPFDFGLPTAFLPSFAFGFSSSSPSASSSSPSASSSLFCPFVSADFCPSDFFSGGPFFGLFFEPGSFS